VLTKRCLQEEDRQLTVSDVKLQKYFQINHTIATIKYTIDRVEKPKVDAKVMRIE
jgi:hypothetical protein